MNRNYENREFWILRAFIFSFVLFVFFAFNSSGNSNDTFENNTASASATTFSINSAILVPSADFFSSFTLRISSDINLPHYAPNYNHFLSCKDKETTVLQKEWDALFLNHKHIQKKFFSLPRFSSGSMDDYLTIS